MTLQYREAHKHRRHKGRSRAERPGNARVPRDETPTSDKEPEGAEVVWTAPPPTKSPSRPTQQQLAELDAKRREKRQQVYTET